MNQAKPAKVKEIIYADYIAKTPKSKELFERANKSLVGGIGSSKRYHEPHPIMFEYGRGGKIYDVDGNEYINTCLNAGPLLLGHDHPELMEAAGKAMEKGLMVQNTPLFIECAEMIQELVPCAEKVRLCNTGTEAVLFAIRTVKAYTQKNKIIKFYGHFHGLVDEVCVGIGGPRNGPDSAGIPEDYIKHTIPVNYHDIDAVRQVLDNDDDVAAVILDPQMNAGGIWPASREYMQALRRLTQERGVILIFDEVITGFRWAPGGAQEWYGVTPDLVALAKGIGSGGKLGAIAGKKEVMSILTPKGMAGAPSMPVMQAGTYIDNTVSLATSIAAMKVYKRLGEAGEYEKLHARARRFKEGAIDAFAKRGMPLQVNIMGPTVKLYITGMELTYENVLKHYDHSASDLFITAMIVHGVFLSIPTLRTIYFSFAHTDEEIDRLIEAVNTCLDEYNFKSLANEIFY